MNLKQWVRKLPAVQPAWAIGIGAFTTLAYLVTLVRRGEPPGLAASEKYIAGLDSRLQPLARRFLLNAHVAGIAVVLTSGRRNNSEQAKLYAQGRTAPGNIVTNAEPGESWHNYGLAFDTAILVDGKPTWPAVTNPVWKQLGAIGAKLGLEHGLRFNDKEHFDFHPGLTLAQAQAGQRLA